MTMRSALLIGATVLSSMQLGQNALARDCANPNHGYLGRIPPGQIPEVFLEMPGRYVQDADISPNMMEIFFTESNATWDDFTLYSIRRRKNGAWTEPVKPSFLGDLTGALRPYSSTDGMRLFFISESPRDPWVAFRKWFGWFPALRLPAPIDSDAIENSIHESADGTLYFCSHRTTEVSKGGCDIYYAKLQNGCYKEAVNLGQLNAESNDCGPVVSPNGRFLVFHSNRTGGYGTADLYASFKQNDGDWSRPVNLGPDVNTDALEVIAHFSPDGKYLLFTRRAGFQTEEPSKVYWVRADILNALKP